MRTSILLLSALFLFSCVNDKKEQSPEKIIDNFKAIEGEWELQGSGSSFDNWTISEKGMIGQGLYIDNVGDTTISEVYFLEPHNESVRLQVLGGIDSTIDYYITESSKNIFVFVNMQHNFPKKITYILNKNEYEVFLEGDIGSGMQQTNLVYRKKK